MNIYTTMQVGLNRREQTYSYSIFYLSFPYAGISYNYYYLIYLFYFYFFKSRCVPYEHDPIKADKVLKGLHIFLEFFLFITDLSLETPKRKILLAIDDEL